MDKRSRALASLAAASLLAGAAPAPRKPTSAWILDYGLSACTAVRSYGSEDKPLTLAFRPSPNGKVVRLVVARSGGAPAPYHFPVKVRIGSDTVRTTGLRFEPKGGKADMVWINLERAALQGLIGAGEIGLDGGRAIDESFALPAIAKVLDGLDRCNADLRKYWNVDDAGLPLSAPAWPVKPLRKYFSGDDYPAQAGDEHKGGDSVVMLMVDEKGAPKDCLVEQTSGIASLDAMGCIVLLERAKFRPALGASGKPVRSVLTQRIAWRMP